MLGLAFSVQYYTVVSDKHYWNSHESVSDHKDSKDQSSKQRSGQEESPHLPKHTHSQLDTLSEELTDRDAVDQPSTTGVMKKLEAGFSSVFQEEEEDKTFTEDQDTQEK
ncbi:protein phosphatase 1 regulatory subunit 1C isoform X1 [Tachysurus ichikawai]